MKTIACIVIAAFIFDSVIIAINLARYYHFIKNIKTGAKCRFFIGEVKQYGTIQKVLRNRVRIISGNKIFITSVKNIYPL